MKFLSVVALLIVYIVFSPIFDKDKQYTLLNDCSPKSDIYITYKTYNSTTQKPHYPKKRPKYINVN